jgi:hypothetical protein
MNPLIRRYVGPTKKAKKFRETSKKYQLMNLNQETQPMPKIINRGIHYPRYKNKGAFPKAVIDLCKECPKIYCNGWALEDNGFVIIYQCDERTVQLRREQIK